MNIRIRLFIIMSFAFVVATKANDIRITQSEQSDEVSTQLFQQAIDQCSATGGGQIYVAAGTYTVGALKMKSGVELHLSQGVLLKGSVNHPEDYKAGRGIITAKDVENIAVTGLGVIDGQGFHNNFQRYGNNQGNRPHAIFMENCRNVTIRDIHIRNAAWWTVRLFRCDGVAIDHVNIYSHSIVNNDGLDIDSRNVTISNCRIDSDDDGICLKSDDPDFMPENIVVTNCIIGSNCNPIKLGTSSYCGFRNVTFSNIVILPPTESNVWDWSKEYREVQKGQLTGLAGIAVEAVDGGHIENLLFNNISMTGVITPIFVCLNKRNGIGSIKNVVFSNITAKAYGIIPSLISSIPGEYIDGITIRDIVVEHVGKGTSEDAQTSLKENLNGYPENRMYGKTNPACGLYVRHARNITIDNFQVHLQHADARPAVVMEDVQDVLIDKLRDASIQKPETLMRMINCRNVLFRNSNADASTPTTFLKLEGESTANVRCEFPVKKYVVKGKEVATKAVVEY